jgi:phosphatidylglycerophosphate synthase
MYVDDKIADILVNRTHIFANIHPNLITIVSLICNVALYLILMPRLSGTGHFNVGAFTAVVILRCLTDILDGAVARKYNKTSQLGGLLDTLGDVMLIMLFAYYVCRRFNMTYALCWVLFITMAVGIYSLGIYHDHAAAKSYDGHIGRRILAFGTNNTVIVFLVVYLLVVRNIL